MIAAKAQALGLWAALVVGVELQDGGKEGTEEEARAGGRAVTYRSGSTGRCVGHATHGTPLVHVLYRADVRGRHLGDNIVHMFISSQGGDVTVCGDTPRPRREPSPPLSPSPLGPSRERGREKQRDAPAPRRRCIPLVWYWGEGGWIHAQGASSTGSRGPE